MACKRYQKFERLKPQQNGRLALIAHEHQRSAHHLACSVDELSVRLLNGISLARVDALCQSARAMGCILFQGN
jgi:hypothetical protein